MSQIANKEQMINATYEYLLKMAKNLNAPLPKREDLKDLKNEIVTQSRIHDSGWVLNSTQISTTHSGQHITIDKRTIVSK